MAKLGIVNIIGDIGTFGVSLASVMEQVASQPKAKEYLVNINSPGGEVTEGYAIHNYLVGLGKPITTRGIGLVASIATVVFMAGKKRQLYKSTQFLIHNPWTFSEGDADEMERKANELRELENGLVNFYALHTGADADYLQELMKQDRFISAEQALELQFATDVLTPALAYATIKPKNNQDKMSKVGKLIKDAFAALRATGLVFNESVMTADGQELDVTITGETMAAGDTITLGGEPATGEFTLADGTVIIADAGVIVEVKTAMIVEDVAALKATIADLTAKLAEREAENVELSENIEVITNHLRKMKISAVIPTKRSTFNRSITKPDTDVEPSKEEVRARIKELQERSKKRSVIAI